VSAPPPASCSGSPADCTDRRGRAWCPPCHNARRPRSPADRARSPSIVRVFPPSGGQFPRLRGSVKGLLCRTQQALVPDPLARLRRRRPPPVAGLLDRPGDLRFSDCLSDVLVSGCEPEREAPDRVQEEDPSSRPRIRERRRQLASHPSNGVTAATDIRPSPTLAEARIATIGPYRKGCNRVARAPAPQHEPAGPWDRCGRGAIRHTRQGSPRISRGTTSTTTADTSEDCQQRRDHARIVALLTEHPTLAFPRLCHNA
jgi:hypothetical protein